MLAQPLGGVLPRRRARTLRDVQARSPSGEDPARDVLVSGSERGPRLTQVVRRRLRVGAVAVVVAGATVAGAVEVQEWRAAAVEARRVAQLWQLSTSGPRRLWLEVRPPPSLTAVMSTTFSLRNDGEREVTVTRASAGRFVLHAPVTLPPQTSRDLLLQQKLDCTADTLLPPSPPPLTRPTSDPTSDPTWPGELQITATTSHRTRTTTFARPPYDVVREAATCDWLRAGRPEGLAGIPVDALRPGS
jgi:hypothetical protein